MKSTRRTARRRPCKPGFRITVPNGVGPHVRLVFSEMGRQGVTYDELDEFSGVKRATLKAWRKKNAPSLQNLEAALAVLGFDFWPIPRQEILPPGVLSELQPIAERLTLEMPEAIAAVAAIAAGVRGRTRPETKIAA